MINNFLVIKQIFTFKSCSNILQSLKNLLNRYRLKRIRLKIKETFLLKSSEPI